ncbi:MAG: adenylate/guanylate cyclase domain-containing protein [Actinomycetota bacterium]
MAQLLHRTLGDPDEVREFPLGRLEVFQLEDVVIGVGTFEPGWRWSEHIKPVAGTDLCMYRHVGYTLAGVLRVQLEDGTITDVPANSALQVPPRHDAWVVGDEAHVAVDFAGMRAFARPESPDERVLASILFTDIVDSTGTLERIGDAAWRQLLGRFEDEARFEVDTFRGRSFGSTGDGFLAVFDGAARAIRCAGATIEAAERQGIRLRAGVHTGEVEFAAGTVRGIAVHAAARVMSLADAGEVFVSATTAELAAGAGFTFDDRGAHELKGLSGPRQVLSATPAG